MRVYEFAKLHALTSKQVLEALKSEGFDIKSHMSIMPEEAVAYLEKKFVQKSAPAKKEPKPEPKLAPGKEAKKPEATKAPLPKESKKMPQTSPRKPFYQKKAALPEPEVIKPVGPLAVEPMSLGDFAEKTGIPATSVILSLLKTGKACAKNQLLLEEDIYKLCREYEIETTAPTVQKRDVLSGKVNLSQEKTETRLPVVVVMGHVDHGKTTLLDFIRKTRVAAREKGGITQHIGAYNVDSGHGELVFLDTPGHEAFSKIRKRGASVADIAILVVAADDGIMPQTVESIKAIKALGIPVIVAINKIDRVDEQRIEVVKRQMTQHDLLPEEWGGDVICAPISAKEGKGVDHLLEMVALQAEMMDLKASPIVPAQGYVLESKMLKGRGAVATVLCQQGTLKIGDCFKAESVVGRVTSLVDSSGSQLKEVGPSVPVQVTGFSTLAPVGALFEVVSDEEYKKLRVSLAKMAPAGTARLAVSDDLQKFNVILKADTHSSLEAILDAIKKFPKNEVKEIVLLRTGVGDITESDALFADDTDSVVIGFNVKAEQNAQQHARTSSVKIHLFEVIYKLLEQFEEMAAREKEIKKVLTKIGQATVLKVFNVKKLGVIAGCVMNDGRFSDKGIVAVIRGRNEIGRGKIKSLQRDKKTVKEVHTGFEFAFIVDGFEDWQEGDIAECYLNMPA